MRELHPTVYILASGPRGTLYVGVTSDLDQAHLGTQERCNRWVHEEVPNSHSCLVRTACNNGIRNSSRKAIKEWKRLWKIELVEKSNSTWRDLYDELIQDKVQDQYGFRLLPE